MTTVDALPPGLAGFPGDANPAQWRDWARARLAGFEAEVDHDPLANGVRSLACLLARGLANGEAPQQTIAALVKILADDALLGRAMRFRAARETGEAAELIAAALDAAGFATAEAARETLERTLAGVVFTAHPTFATPRALRDAFAAIVDDPMVATDRSAALRRLDGLRHLPDAELDLGDEHADAMAAARNAQEAIRFLNGAVLSWMRQRFGNEAALTPAPVSLATWVGYDLDGRTDIHWAQTFRLRLEEKAAQLARYAREIEAAKGGARLADVVRRLDAASTLAREQARAFAGDLEDAEQVVVAANLLTADDPRKLTSLNDISAAIAAAASTLEAAAAEPLHLTRADMAAFGLGVARIHLRINAAQVRSALRADLELDDEREFLDRTILAAAARRSADVRPRRVNMANIFAEKMTARRQFMLCAQIRKHIDADTPIRFLIAECEAPATVMGAVFLARLHGVDDIVDIAPLFETPEAIERGGRFMERLLDEPQYVDYIRRRGRLCIQLGFSDSGRFMGQLPAAMAVERLHILLTRAMAARGLADIETVLFNTHGESMGRGGAPASMSDRLDHLLTPWARLQYARHGTPLNAESSFQGGDGFLHFQTPALARSTVAQLFSWALTPPKVAPDDAFYRDINFSWDIYRGAKAWQESLFENHDYHVALAAFGPNLLVKTGSRRVRRPASDAARVPSPRSMRAIPNNAILQQLCAPANVFGGLGAVGARERERFAAWVRRSARARGLVAYAATARRLTDLGVLRAYASLFDATLWRILDAGAGDSSPRPHAAIAARLGDLETHTALARLANRFDEDIALLDALLADGRASASPSSAPHDAGAVQDLRILHALRIALVMHGLVLTASAPTFSRRHDLSFNALLDEALALDFRGVAKILAEIFPVAPATADALAGVEEDGDDDAERHAGYPEVRETIVEPLHAIADTVAEISVAISHAYGAYG